MTGSKLNYKYEETLDGVNAISDHINSSRFTLRFLLGINNLAALIKERKNPSKDEFAKLRMFQKLLTVAYSMLELPCYIKMVAPKLLPNVDTSQLARASCQCLTISVLIELSLLAKRYKEASPGDRKAMIPSFVGGFCDLTCLFNSSLPPEKQFLPPYCGAVMTTISSLISFYRNWSATEV
uniref:Importin subunit alpha-6 n=1 Tax=Lygus hesperus TaxID=30085 RepID=A0A0A9YER7_LYGHE